MSNPLISLIMPTYNYSSYIGDAIESVLKQTYTNWELIIVNDGSTDNTEQIVKRYRNEKIKYYKNRTNIGETKSRNIALKNSKGAYIGHLDSDDMLYPNALAEFVKIINLKPECKYIYSNFEDVNITNTSVLRTMIAPDSFSKSNLPGWKAFGMYEKKAAVSVGGHHEFFETCGDGYLALNLALKYKTYHINKVLYIRRIHGKNVSYKIIDGCDKCNKFTKCLYIDKVNKVYFRHKLFDKIKAYLLKLLK